jgi:hypothetical protein
MWRGHRGSSCAKRAGWAQVRAAFVQHTHDVLAQFGDIADLALAEQLGSQTLALSHQAKQQVFGAQIAVAQTVGFGNTELDGALGVLAQPEPPRVSAQSRMCVDQDGHSQVVKLDSTLGQHVGRDAVAFEQQAEQHVLGPDLLM